MANGEQKTINVGELEKTGTPLPPLWIDHASVSSRSDGIVLIVFDAAIPDDKCRMEVCRLLMTKHMAKELLKRINAQLGT